MFDAIMAPLTSMSTVLSIVLLVFYLLQCLFGYKLFKISCAIVGFLIGLLLGYLISNLYLGSPWPIVIGIIAGIVLALLAFKLYLLGLFILIFLLAFGLARKIPFPQSDGWKIASLIIAIAIAVIVAILAVKLSGIVIIVVTAVSGAMNAVSIFDDLTGYLSSSMWYWVVTAILIAIGLVLQFMMNKK